MGIVREEVMSFLLKTGPDNPCGSILLQISYCVSYNSVKDVLHFSDRFSL